MFIVITGDKRHIQKIKIKIRKTHICKINILITLLIESHINYII